MNENTELHIIGNGRITLALLKKILDKRLFQQISKIIVWKRYKHKYDPLFKVPMLNEDLLELYIENNAIAEHNIHFKTFRYLKEINIPDNSLVLLLTRYNLDEFVYLQKGIRIDLLQPFHQEIFFSRLACFTSNMELFISLASLLRFQNLVHSLNKEISKITLDVSLQKYFGKERLYNLRHSVLGVKEISQYFSTLPSRNITILNLINEVDTTSYILNHYISDRTTHIISPCDNDRMRSLYFAKKALRKHGMEFHDFTLSYVGPHNHLGFIPLETILAKDKRISAKLVVKLQNDMPDIMSHLLSFGENVFNYKNSSDEDTVEGLYNAVYSFFSDKNSKKFRCLIYSPARDVFISTEGLFQGKNFISLANYDKILSNDSLRTMNQAYGKQKLLNTNLLHCLKVSSQKYLVQ